MSFDTHLTPVETVRSAALPKFPFILDGEVVVPTETGHSDFGALEDDLGQGRSDRMLYYVFDILHIASWSLSGCSLGDRKHVLAELMDGQKGPVRFGDHIEGGGNALFRRACKLGLEGLVSKRLDGTYHSGRSSSWTKVTCRNRETFYAVGSPTTVEGSMVFISRGAMAMNCSTPARSSAGLQTRW